MRRGLFAAAALSAVVTMGGFVMAEDTASSAKDVTGVLIDTKCAAKQMKAESPEKAAAGHDKDCALKCGKTAGFAVISGSHEYKFDKAGNKLAMAFLEKHDSTKATVHGTIKGDKIKVSSIDEAKDKEAK
ncbi:MAG TPA: hypothetical protein VFC78_11400 [Tepidisphaeraceae bacterium]|nr:hypothetical protein [Tepidisphaeraceae bacterium]